MQDPADDTPPINPFAAGVPSVEVEPVVSEPVVGAVPMRAPVTLLPLRPMTILVAMAAGIYSVALGYSAYSTARFSFDREQELRNAVEPANQIYWVGILALAVAVPLWLFVAGVNARRLCHDRSRYHPIVAALAFVFPVLQLAMIGNAMTDLWRHSHETRQPKRALVTAFRVVVLLELPFRALAFVAPPAGELSKAHKIDALMFSVLALGSPIELMITDVWYQGIATFIAIASLAVPVLGMLACFAIESAQLDTYRRIRTREL